MKYEILWNISKEINGVKVYRIRATKDFSNVKAGDLGGYVQYPHNLSQAGDCWVYDDAQVYDNAKVYGNAKVCGRAELFGSAEMQSGRIRKIKSNKITAVFEGQGRAVTATLNKGKIEVEVGCFYGDLQEFEKRIYKDGNYRSYDELPPHREEYLGFIKELKTKEKVS